MINSTQTRQHSAAASLQESRDSTHFLHRRHMSHRAGITVRRPELLCNGTDSVTTKGNGLPPDDTFHVAGARSPATAGTFESGFPHRHPTAASCSITVRLYHNKPAPPDPLLPITASRSEASAVLRGQRDEVDSHALAEKGTAPDHRSDEKALIPQEKHRLPPHVLVSYGQYGGECGGGGGSPGNRATPTRHHTGQKKLKFH